MDTEYKVYKAMARLASFDKDYDAGRVYPSLSEATRDFYDLQHLSAFLQSKMPTEADERIEVVLSEREVQLVDSIGGWNGDIGAMIAAIDEVTSYFHWKVMRGKSLYHQEFSSIEVKTVPPEDDYDMGSFRSEGRRFASVFSGELHCFYEVKVYENSPSATVYMEKLTNTRRQEEDYKEETKRVANKWGWNGPVNYYVSHTGNDFETTILPVVKQVELGMYRKFQAIPRLRRLTPESR